MSDRVGIGWRPELAAGIFASLDRIDVLEVVADEYFDASRAQRHALRFLARQRPVMLHAVGLGLASAELADSKRVDRLARLVGEVGPESWSEHLAFVRAGGREVGHLAAPPWNAATVEGAARNIRHAHAVVGSWPEMENVATLVRPPREMDEADWISNVVRESGCGLLLDLHNLYANCANFYLDPLDALKLLPLDRVSTIHIAGGRWLEPPNGGAQRLLDDHLHPVPDEVFDLLVQVAALVQQPLTVVLERDGAFPRMNTLLAELGLARAALEQGRRTAFTVKAGSAVKPSAPARSGNAADLQAYMAVLYTDPNARRDFLRHATEAAAKFGLSHENVVAVSELEPTGLQMAAASFGRKREGRQRGRWRRALARWRV